MNKILKKQAVQLMNCLFFIFLCGNCLAQKAYPEIRVSYISELQKGIQDSHWILDSDLVSSPGMIPFGNGNYTDSLINHLDTIQPADWRTPKGNYPVFLAIWGNDTLSYARLPDTLFYYRNDNKQKKKIRVLEVESQLPPYTRFAADVEGLSEKEISALTDFHETDEEPSRHFNELSANMLFLCLGCILPHSWHLPGSCHYPQHEFQQERRVDRFLRTLS